MSGSTSSTDGDCGCGGAPMREAPPARNRGGALLDAGSPELAQIRREVAAHRAAKRRYVQQFFARVPKENDGIPSLASIHREVAAHRAMKRRRAEALFASAPRVGEAVEVPTREEMEREVMEWKAAKRKWVEALFATISNEGAAIEVPTLERIAHEVQAHRAERAAWLGDLFGSASQGGVVSKMPGPAEGHARILEPSGTHLPSMELPGVVGVRGPRCAPLREQLQWPAPRVIGGGSALFNGLSRQMSQLQTIYPNRVEKAGTLVTGQPTQGALGPPGQSRTEGAAGPLGPATGVPLASQCSVLGYSRFHTGIIDFWVPERLDVPESEHDAARDMMLYPIASPEQQAVWLPWDTLEDYINPSWGAGDEVGKFIGRSSGRNRAFILWVLQSIVALRGLIPFYWPDPEIESRLGRYRGMYCVGLAGLLLDHFENDTGTLRVYQPGDTVDCLAVPSPDQMEVTISGTDCERTYNIYYDRSSPTTWRRGWNGTSGITFCPATVNAHALVADEFLHWGSRAYWTAMSGRADGLIEAFQLLRQAQLCGQVALGSMLMVARTMMHELAHRLLSERHCDTACCPQGLAGLWWARSRAYCGAPQVTTERAGVASVDTAWAVVSENYGSSCGRSELSLDVTFADLRHIGDYWTYTVDDISIPADCPPDSP